MPLAGWACVLPGRGSRGLPRPPCTTTLAAKLPVSQGVGDVDSAPWFPDSTHTSGPTRSLAYFCRC